MTRIWPLIAFLLGMTSVWAGASTQPEMKPLSAADAERRVTETQDFLVDLLWEHTDVHWHAGRWDEAIRLCHQVIELDPGFVEAYTGAAWLLWSMDRDEEAIEFYRAGLAANPDSYEIPHEFGMYYHHRHNWDQAAEQFRKAVELRAPSYLQHMLPNVLERAGKKREALSEWRALSKRFPNDPIPRRHIEALVAELEGEQQL